MNDGLNDPCIPALKPTAKVRMGHSYDVLAGMISDVLLLYKIQNKVHRVMTDNGSKVGKVNNAVVKDGD